MGGAARASREVGDRGIAPLVLNHQDLQADLCIPLLASADRMRALDPEYPRIYAVAWMAREPRRRWWPLAAALSEDRLEQMHSRMVRDLGKPGLASAQVANVVIHAVVSRVMALIALEGRAWDPGIDNLWLHYDSDGGVDWAGVVDPALRVLHGDPVARARRAVEMPCEEALVVWAAHRCETTLVPLFARISEFTGVDRDRLWSMVGEAVIGTATYAPQLAGCDDAASLRRGRGFLDALARSGLPVRSHASHVRLRWRGTDPGPALPAIPASA
ncbi:hypothetical protein [Hoyosella altamirensis]|uniref:Iron reductase n=1 Tax=Hoyosella altamirensis TaxID=616997 RepID=A0A839RJL5_9ACTN|nr:hypothetical protein [Hoyosella altamirensis]MBB3036316.1 hypothetical protein [Hoyosella altamirensis]